MNKITKKDQKNKSRTLQSTYSETIVLLFDVSGLSLGDFGPRFSVFIDCLDDILSNLQSRRFFGTEFEDEEDERDLRPKLI